MFRVVDLVAHQGVPGLETGIISVDHAVGQFAASGIAVVLVLADPVACPRDFIALAFGQIAGGAGRTAALFCRGENLHFVQKRY